MLSLVTARCESGDNIKVDIGEIVVIYTNNQSPSPSDANLSLCFYMIYVRTKIDV